MATILVGPRLGPPSDSGFSVWLRLDSSIETITLEAREYASGDAWSLASAAKPVSSKRDTIVLSASSLSAGVRYEYRISDESAVLHSSSTWTMPGNSSRVRFYVYWVSDTHEDNDSAYTQILDDFETNVEPLGIPAFILQGGDLVVPGNKATIELWGDEVELELAKIAGSGKATERLPYLYNTDDHDSYGNNCSVEFSIAFGSEPGGHIAAGLEAYDWYWRDQPTLPIGTANQGFYTEVCGIPFIGADCRTFRSPQYGTTPDEPPFITDGNEDYDPAAPTRTFLGVAQRDWLIDKFLDLKGRRELIFFHTSECWLSKINKQARVPGVAPPSPGARDSVGIFWEPERNYFLRRLAPSYATSGEILWIHGDDHRNAVWKTRYNESTTWSTYLPGAVPGVGIGWHGYTFITRAGSNDTGVGGSSSLFGEGDILDMRTAFLGALVKMQVDVGPQGVAPELRMTYREIAFNSSILGDVYVGSRGGNVGREGDFLWRAGRLYWADDSTDVLTGAPYRAQSFPPENGQYGVSFKRTFIEQVGGLPDRDVMRDSKGRLAAYHLIDKLDREDERYRQPGPRRVEIPPEPLG